MMAPLFLFSLPTIKKNLSYQRMKCFLLLLLVILMASQIPAAAQDNTARIHGKIFTPDNQPASFVTVFIKELGLKAKANNRGIFSFTNLPPLKDTLTISGVGFTTFKLPIELRINQDLRLENINLAYGINQLGHVEITGRQATSYKSDYSFLANKTQSALIDVPQAVSTVTKELFNDRMQLHLTDALEEVSGVTHYSGYDEYNIRGLHADNPHLINGLRTFNTSLTTPLLLNIERIEVIKGPSCVLYGNADPGGTINLVTRKPLPMEQYSFLVGAGSWDANNAQIDLTGPMNKTGTWLYRLNAGYEDKNSFRHGYFLKASQIAPSFSFIPNKKWQVNFDLSMTSTNSVVDRGQPAFNNEPGLSSTPISLSLIQPGDYLVETSVSALLSTSYKINEHISYNAGILYFATNQNLSEHFLNSYITNDSVSLGYNHSAVNTSTITITNYFTFQFNTGRLKHELLTGYDFISSNVNSNQWNGSLSSLDPENEGIVGGFSLRHPQYFTRPVSSYTQMAPDSLGEDDDGIYHTHALYVQDQVTFQKWQLLAALRSEFYTAGDADAADAPVSHINKLIPRIGVTYSVSKNIRAYATYNQGFDPFEPAAVTQVFNEPYKPVNSSMGEAGAKANFFKSRLFASVALYQITINNFAVNANDLSNPNLYVQRGAERSRGIETELQGNLLPNLSVALNYAYNVTEISKSVNRAEVGRIIENAPRNSSSSWIKYNFNKGKLKGFGIAAGHTQASIRNTLESGFTLPGYLVLNSGVQYSKSHFTLAVNLNNILNTTYWASAYNNTSKWPGEPRNLRLRFGYRF